MGTNEPRGDANFYANNKTTKQPGCPLKPCGHTKAIFYYFASLFPEYEFIGVACEQQDFRGFGIVLNRFGFFADDIEGNFCFNTTSCFPFTDESSMTELPNIVTEINDTTTAMTPSGENSSLTEIQKSIKRTNKYLKSGKMILSKKDKLCEPNCDVNCGNECKS